MGLLWNLALNFNIRVQIGLLDGMKIITGSGNINLTIRATLLHLLRVKIFVAV